MVEKRIKMLSAAWPREKRTKVNWSIRDAQLAERCERYEFTDVQQGHWLDAGADRVVFGARQERYPEFAFSYLLGFVSIFVVLHRFSLLFEAT